MAFLVDGDISRLRIPAPVVAPRVGAQLWQHTCFEAFIAAEGLPGYHEFNFAPSGEWAVYAFRTYRIGGPVADEEMRPRIDVHSTSSRFELDVLVRRLDRMSPGYAHGRLRIGLSAVLEGSDGLSYWALHHPADKPDFHHPDGLALLLEAPGPVR